MVAPSPFTYVSGYKNRFQSLIRHLVEAGDEVMVVTGGPDAPSDFHGASVVQGWTSIIQGVPQTYALTPRVWRKIKEFKPDLIHASSPATLDLAAVIYARRLSIPLVISYHTNVEHYIPRYFGKLSFFAMRLYRFLMGFAHGHADLNLGTSPQAANDIVRWQWRGFSHKRAKKFSKSATQVWEKGVDSDIFNPRHNDWNMRSILTDGHPSDPLVICVGRLGPEKNLYSMRDVMRQLEENYGIKARLAIVGDGPEMEGLKKHYNGTRTVLTGSLSGEDLSRAFASADVFFMPSESETLGFVVLEAMASGTPVVAVKAGGIPDIIQKEGEVAYLFPPGETAVAASQLANLIKDKELNKRIAEAGRKEVSQWDWKAATMKLRRQYNDAFHWHDFRLERRRVRRRRWRRVLASLFAVKLGHRHFMRRKYF